MPHNELLIKLWSIGITGNCWHWIQEYLHVSRRTQQVCINGCYSFSLPVISGVPLGSILGPLLFLLYVNDLPNEVSHSTPYLFADDTKCLKSISSNLDSLQLQQDLNSLSAWSVDWKLSFNELKCILLSFQSSNTLNSQSALTPTISSYQVNGHVVTPNLNTGMSYDLSWTSHLSLTAKQAYKNLGLLRWSFSAATNTSAKKSLYLSLVRSQLVYCSQVWHPHIIKDFKLLKDVQRRASKFILNDYTPNYKTHLLQLCLLPLSIFYELNDIYFFVKPIKQLSSSFNILNYVSFSCNNTRSASLKLVQPLVLNNRHKHFFFT